MTSGRLRALCAVAAVIAAAVACVAPTGPAAAAPALPDLAALQWAPQRIGAAEARARVAQQLGSITVAVLDSGVATHPDLPTLDASDAAHANFTSDPGGATDDGSGHGTHVAGIIAAATGGGGVDGVAPGVRLLPVKVVSDSGTGRASWVARGIDYAVAHGADVINLSVVSPETSAELEAALAAARTRGVVLVAAAGNEGATANPLAYPAASPGVIAVGATDRADRVPSFSETGPQVDLVAPGVDVASTAPGGLFRTMTGTSEAAPHVAATAALVLAAAPGSSPDAVEQVLERTATDLGAAGRDDTTGHGLVNASRAVTAALSPAPGGARTPVATATSATAPTGRAGLRLVLPVQVRGADGSAPTDGVVSVADGDRVLAERSLRSGRVVLPLRGLAAGAHALVVSYRPSNGGAPTYAPSTTTVALTTGS